MIVPLHRCRTAEVIHGARNDTTFAPFVRSLFPVDSARSSELAGRSLTGILLSALSQGDLAKDPAFAPPDGRTLTKCLSEEPA